MKKVQAGFTLVELMITLAVAIIVLAVGIPMYGSIVANNRAVAQANMFVTALNMAKSEAVAQGIPVAVCANASATNVTASSLTCGGSGDWANGWFVFQDVDSDATRDSSETVLKLWQALEPGSNVTASVGFVRYSSIGENTGSATDFELTQDETKGNQTRCVFVNAMGQIRTERNACP